MLGLCRSVSTALCHQLGAMKQLSPVVICSSGFSGFRGMLLKVGRRLTKVLTVLNVLRDGIYGKLLCLGRLIVEEFRINQTW